jgi:hypothetical protein
LIAASTRALRRGLTYAVAFTTAETVATETSAARATS